QGGAILSLTSSLTPLTMCNMTIAGDLALTGGTVTFDATNNGTATMSGNIDHGGAAISYDVADGTAAIDMVISGAMSHGAFIKTGLGTMNLTGNSPLEGAATVSSGILLVNGVLGNGGALSITSGARLGGSGTIQKSVQVDGTLSPGNSIGTLNIIGDTSFAHNSNLEIELNSTTSDLLNITGSLTIDTGANL